MRINDLLVENEQLDELSLAGIGRGIGAAAGAIGRGVGNVQGAWQGAKAAYNQNKDTAANKAARNVAHGGGAQMSKTGAPGGTAQQPAAPAPQGQAAPASNQQVSGGEVASNNLLARAQQGTTQDPNAQQPAGTPAPAQPAAQPAAAPAAQPAAPAAPADMKAGEIVQGLQDVWGKATASKGSQTSAPAVQQQIKQMAKDAAMAGQTVESVKFRSNFLGMDI